MYVAECSGVGRAIQFAVPPPTQLRSIDLGFIL